MTKLYLYQIKRFVFIYPDLLKSPFIVGVFGVFVDKCVQPLRYDGATREFIQFPDFTAKL